ncbi:MAG: hypothetical protein N2044_08925 [Cyclobacteriaceae bacterium]|nr:hypothetical protein [Cyclobacteriaceae bacterium]
MFCRVTLVGFILLVHSASAQELTCEQILNQAGDEFNSGRFYGIPRMLADCLDKGFTREQRQRAYLLLVQTYLVLDDPIAAENSYLEVLRANPEYMPDPQTDPIDLVYLSKKFTASPVISVFGRVGINVSPVRVIYSVPSSVGLNAENTQYGLRSGFQLAFGGDWHISENIALMGELVGISSVSYKRTRDKMFGGSDYQLFKDNLTWFNTSFGLKYSFSRFFGSAVRKFVPQTYGGVTLGYLISDRGSVESFNNDPTDTGLSTIIAGPSSFDFLPYRNRLNYQVFGGASVKYKWGLEYLFVDLRYGFGMLNVVKPSSTYAGSPAQEFAHVDDYFRLDNLSLSVGYVKPFYRPRKLRKARTQSVIRQIKKSDVKPNN